MRVVRYCLAALLIAVFSAYAWRGDVPRDDPLDEVAEALAQGRHWYATRLLRKLDGPKRGRPEATLLAARAEAGRGAWAAVTRRLESAAWLDSISFGEGRALLARAWLEVGHHERAVRDFEIFLAYSVERTPRAIAEVGLARALTALRQGRAAAAAYERAAKFAPELAPYLAIRAAESLAPTADTAGVRRQLERAEGVPVPRRALAEARAQQEAGDVNGALRVLLKAAATPGAGDWSADLRTRAARILLEAGDTAAARGALRTAIRTRPGAARQAADLLASLPGLRAEDRLDLGHSYERSGARAQAASQYREYLRATRLGRKDRDQMWLKIGRQLFRARAYSSAIRELEQLLDSRPTPAVRVQAEYLIARATYRRGRRSEGRARLRAVSDNFPGTASAINALALLGDVYESSGDVSEARAIYEELTERYSWTRAAGRARFRLGILAFTDADYSSAQRHFDLARRPNQRSDLRLQATYWAARARQAQGEEHAADAERLFRQVHARDPFGYYGLLAAERAGIDPWADLPPGPEPAALDARTAQKFRTIVRLRQAGLSEEGGTVLESIVNGRLDGPEDLLGLSAELADRGFGGDAVRLGWRAHSQLRGLWSTSVLRAIYPLAYPEIILAESRSRRLDPHLLAAIARQESAFAPDVISRAGARGLLQIMPQTGRWWAGRLGVRDYSDELLFDPEINVHLGAAYFADLQRQYRELQLALVAYNAGPTRARRWRNRPDYRADPELFAESIPISETRGYVRAVQTQLRIYRHLYSDFGLFGPAD